MAVPRFTLRRNQTEPPQGEIGRPSDALWIGGLSTFGATAGSIVMPEYNPKLQGGQGIRTYDEMRRSSSEVRASLRQVKASVLNAQWYMQAASEDPQDQEISDFAWWNVTRMWRSFPTLLREALGCLDFGYYPFELVWELTDWTPPTDPSERKAIDRSVWAWQDWSPLHPSKVSGFIYDQNNHVDKVLYGRTNVPINIEKLALFSFESEGDDPGGMSMLRSAYQSWWYGQMFNKLDGIQKEKHAIGIPDVELQPGHTPKDIATARELGRNLRANEKAYVVRNQFIKVGYIEPKGHLVDVMASVKHHGLGVQTALGTQHMALGTQSSGSRSVGVTLSAAFDEGTHYIIDFMRNVINGKIKQLIDFNYDVRAYPELRARRFDEARLRAMSVGYQNLVNSGLLTPGPEDEEWARDYLDFPAISNEGRARTSAERLTALDTAKGAGQAGKPTM